ncbi:hypothetical protein [Rothia sp. ZJ1223]|nr:hypothetical protein [Rothia sp. ZJ1223]MBM7051878.1 hypothetical protein [Rothia sp. ZJ1223]
MGASPLRINEMFALLYDNRGTHEEMLATNIASNELFPKQPIPGALE